eukprot:scaffold11862_cov21-Tisochrysis_lutea.AAC.1
MKWLLDRSLHLLGMNQFHDIAFARPPAAPVLKEGSSVKTRRGPGCSSVGGGFLSELGAFLPKPDGKTLQSWPTHGEWLELWGLPRLVLMAKDAAGVVNTASIAHTI